MSNSVFPSLPGLAWGTTMAPSWSTAIKKAASGRELRAAFMAYPLWQFSLNYEFLQDGKRGTDLDKLVGFFLMMRGQYDSFLFTSPADNAVTAENFGIGNGSTVAFQFTRAFGAGGYTFVEPVQNLNGTPSIYINGTLKTAGTDYTISSTGVVTFTAAPGAGLPLTWTGSFYYRCRFTMDTADLSQFMADLWEMKKLSFVGAPGNKV